MGNNPRHRGCPTLVALAMPVCDMQPLGRNEGGHSNVRSRWGLIVTSFSEASSLPHYPLRLVGNGLQSWSPAGRLVGFEAHKGTKPHNWTR